MTTNVPPIAWTAAGPVAPTAQAILAGVQADFDAAFGVAFNWNQDTPQGQLAASITAMIQNANDSIVYYATQIDPAFSTGRMQDAIARIYFLERIGAEPTAVTATITGLEGTVVPTGSLAIATDGRIYRATGDVTIPPGGTIEAQFACTEVGPIPCPAGSLNKIYQAIPGWDTINNAADGTIGNNTEDAIEFEARRVASVAKNALGTVASIAGEVGQVPNVIDYYVTQNDTGSPATIGGVVLVAHSLYVAVVGGDSAAVARAIWTKKPPGCAYNGNTTVTVEDTSSGYDPPYPSYQVTFQIPDPLQVLFAVSIVNSAAVPADAVDQIKAAIIAAASGSDGGARARIGSTLYATRYVTPIGALGSWAQVITLKIGSTNAPDASFTGSIAGTVLTVSAVASGALAVGQTVVDVAGDILPGTRIASLGTGVGGTGTYNLTTSQTLASRAMKSALANDDFVTSNIDQIPTVEAENIVVTLV